MENETCKLVKWLLLSLNLCDYTRVYIREHGPQGIIYVGGGYPGKVMQRYGNRLVVDSSIYESSLILYVRPDVRVSDHWGDWCDQGRRVCACTGGSCCGCDSAYSLEDNICPLDCLVPLKSADCAER